MFSRRLLGTAGVGAVLALSVMLIFGGAAFAQTDEASGTSLGQAFVDKLAEKLGLTSDELESAMDEARSEAIDDAVASGDLTEEQGEALKERAANGPGWFGFGPGGPGGVRHAAFGGAIDLDVIAETLGMTTAELQAELEAGATLSEIITAQGSTVEAVVDALIVDVRADLDTAVAEGDITQEQADERLIETEERLTEAINNDSLMGPRNCPAPGDDSTDNPDEETTEETSIQTS